VGSAALLRALALHDGHFGQAQRQLQDGYGQQDGGVGLAGACHQKQN
jgi:hypothetical protein